MYHIIIHIYSLKTLNIQPLILTLSEVVPVFVHVLLLCVLILHLVAAQEENYYDALSSSSTVSISRTTNS